MPIKYFTEDTAFNLKNKKLLKEWIISAVENENKIAGELNYIFTSDNYLIQINNEYLSHNYFTDIVTFNYCQDNIVSGDIFISIDTVKNNSKRFGVTQLNELHRVMIHGILHLIGYNDQNEEQKAEMREKENFYLERLENLF